MRDLRTALSYCFECVAANTYSISRSISFTDKSSYMLIPVTGDNIEIPTMAMFSLPTLENKILQKEPIDALAVNLNNNGGYSPFKSVSASIRDAFTVLYKNAHLRKLVTVGDPEKTYYGTYGAIFDENFKPIVMLSWELKKIYRDNEQDPFRYKFIRPILRVAPEVFINKSNTVERFIINQIIPTALSITYLSSPIFHRSMIYESNSGNCKVKVLIEKIPFIIKETDVPSISTTNEELLDTALNYIDEIIE
uniref:Uncharacterized protein n=1 Tax=CrAss-like virus sp. ctjK323 TaxID=2825839 RepID=A0A8S5Q0D2_9CAUD|nr:MAG TPA: hypothetical protein [CrAss-like virus sp. ctjK323]